MPEFLKKLGAAVIPQPLAKMAEPVVEAIPDPMADAFSIIPRTLADLAGAVGKGLQKSVDKQLTPMPWEVADNDAEVVGYNQAGVKRIRTFFDNPNESDSTKLAVRQQWSAIPAEERQAYVARVASMRDDVAMVLPVPERIEAQASADADVQTQVFDNAIDSGLLSFGEEATPIAVPMPGQMRELFTAAAKFAQQASTDPKALLNAEFSLHKAIEYGAKSVAGDHPEAWGNVLDITDPVTGVRSIAEGASALGAADQAIRFPDLGFSAPDAQRRKVTRKSMLSEQVTNRIWRGYDNDTFPHEAAVLGAPDSEGNVLDLATICGRYGTKENRPCSNAQSVFLAEVQNWLAGETEITIMQEEVILKEGSRVAGGFREGETPYTISETVRNAVAGVVPVATDLAQRAQAMRKVLELPEVRAWLRDKADDDRDAWDVVADVHYIINKVAEKHGDLVSPIDYGGLDAAAPVHVYPHPVHWEWHQIAIREADAAKLNTWAQVAQARGDWGTVNRIRDRLREMGEDLLDSQTNWVGQTIKSAAKIVTGVLAIGGSAMASVYDDLGMLGSVAGLAVIDPEATAEQRREVYKAWEAKKQELFDQRLPRTLTVGMLDDYGTLALHTLYKIGADNAARKMGITTAEWLGRRPNEDRGYDVARAKELDNDPLLTALMVLPGFALVNKAAGAGISVAKYGKTAAKSGYNQGAVKQLSDGLRNAAAKWNDARRAGKWQGAINAGVDKAMDEITRQTVLLRSREAEAGPLGKLADAIEADVQAVRNAKTFEEKTDAVTSLFSKAAADAYVDVFRTAEGTTPAILDSMRQLTDVVDVAGNTAFETMVERAGKLLGNPEGTARIFNRLLAHPHEIVANSERLQRIQRILKTQASQSEATKVAARSMSELQDIARSEEVRSGDILALWELALQGQGQLAKALRPKIRPYMAGQEVADAGVMAVREMAKDITAPTVSAEIETMAARKVAMNGMTPTQAMWDTISEPIRRNVAEWFANHPGKIVDVSEEAATQILTLDWIMRWDTGVTSYNASTNQVASYIKQVIDHPDLASLSKTARKQLAVGVIPQLWAEISTTPIGGNVYLPGIGRMKRPVDATADAGVDASLRVIDADKLIERMAPSWKDTFTWSQDVARSLFNAGALDLGALQTHGYLHVLRQPRYRKAEEIQGKLRTMADAEAKQLPSFFRKSKEGKQALKQAQTQVKLGIPDGPNRIVDEMWTVLQHYRKGQPPPTLQAADLARIEKYIIAEWYGEDVASASRWEVAVKRIEKNVFGEMESTLMGELATDPTKRRRFMTETNWTPKTEQAKAYMNSVYREMYDKSPVMRVMAERRLKNAVDVSTLLDGEARAMASALADVWRGQLTDNVRDLLGRGDKSLSNITSLTSPVERLRAMRALGMTADAINMQLLEALVGPQAVRQIRKSIEGTFQPIEAAKQLVSENKDKAGIAGEQAWMWVRKETAAALEAADLVHLQAMSPSAYGAAFGERAAAFIVNPLGETGTQINTAWQRVLNKFVRPNLTTYRLPSTIRDYTSNRFVVAPMEGLSPGSKAWELAHKLWEFEDIGLTAELTAAKMGPRAPESGIAKTILDEGDTVADKASMWLRSIADRGVGGAVGELIKTGIVPATTVGGDLIAHLRSVTDVAPRVALLLHNRFKRAGVVDADSIFQSLAKAFDETKGKLVRDGMPLRDAKRFAADEITAVVNELTKSLPDTVKAETLQISKDAFGNSVERSALLKMASRHPLAPTFLNYTAKMLPRMAKWIAKHPVQSMVQLQAFDAWAAAMYTMSTGDGDWASMDDANPLHQVIMPLPMIGRYLDQSSVAEGVGFDSPKGLDVTYYSAITDPSGMSPLTGSLLLDAGWTAATLAAGDVPRRGWPVEWKNGWPQRLGAPMAQRKVGPWERVAQTAASWVGGFTPDWMPWATWERRYGEKAGVDPVLQAKPGNYFLNKLVGRATDTKVTGLSSWQDDSIAAQILRAVGFSTKPMGKPWLAMREVGGELREMATKMHQISGLASKSQDPLSSAVAEMFVATRMYLADTVETRAMEQTDRSGRIPTSRDKVRQEQFEELVTRYLGLLDDQARAEDLGMHWDTDEFLAQEQRLSALIQDAKVGKAFLAIIGGEGTEDLSEFSGQQLNTIRAMVWYGNMRSSAVQFARELRTLHVERVAAMVDAVDAYPDAPVFDPMDPSMTRVAFEQSAPMVSERLRQGVELVLDGKPAPGIEDVLGPLYTAMNLPAPARWGRAEISEADALVFEEEMTGQRFDKSATRSASGAISNVMDMLYGAASTKSKAAMAPATARKAQGRDKWQRINWRNLK